MIRITLDIEDTNDVIELLDMFGMAIDKIVQTYELESEEAL